MQMITIPLKSSDPFLKRACDLINTNNPDRARAEIRPARNPELMAVYIVNGLYKMSRCNYVFHQQPEPTP